jgi:hypothetical protein
MNSQVIRIASLAALLVPGAWAQLAHPLVVDVPFEFSAGKTTLAAGEYQVKMQQPNVLRISTTDGKHGVMILTSSKISSNAPTESKMMFNRYGDRYFLSQVWTAGVPTGVELRKTSTEIELAKRISEPGDATVVARKR